MNSPHYNLTWANLEVRFSMQEGDRTKALDWLLANADPLAVADFINTCKYECVPVPQPIMALKKGN